MTKTKTRHSHQDDFHGDIAKLKEALFDTAAHVRNRATGAFTDSVDTMREKSVEQLGNVKEYVSDRPIKSLGIAMLSGMLLGYLMHGKRNSHRR